MSAEAVAGYELDDIDAPMYSTCEAAELCGLPYAMLHRFGYAGAITSTVAACGTGSRRRWSSLEVDRLQRLADVHRAAAEAGLLMTLEAITDIWQTLENGETWRLVLAA